MARFYVVLGLFLMSPLLIFVIVFESTIAIPIMLYTIIRMKMNEYKREHLRREKT